MTKINPFFNYKPKKSSDIIGQNKAVKDIEVFLNTFKKGKGLFLYGPTGTGKTSSVYAFAKELGYEVLELNASDGRNQGALDDFLSKATGQFSLFNPKKLILIDEVDGLSGMNDRGATTAIANYLVKSTFPIVITGENPFDKKFSGIQKICKLVEFTVVEAKDVLLILQKICDEEKIKVDEKILKQISRECSGDVRAALIDLFSYTIGKEHFGKDVEFGERKRTDTMNDALIRVLKSTDQEVFLGAYDNVDEDLDKIFLWLDENIGKEYTNIEDLAKAYENLSLGDVYFGRIRRWQYYRFYVYCFQILSAGIALAKKMKYPIPPKYSQPMRLLKYWKANMNFAKRKTIIEKIAEKTNISLKRALKDVYPYIITALIHDKKLAEEFELTSEEISWLKENYKIKK
jgi:replication factor C large subunit